MRDDSQDGDGSAKGREGVLLMRTWSDAEAEIVRQILDSHGIPSQVVSDVPHTVLPISVDGLGEVRVLVPADRLALAKTLIAEHRRQGMEMVRGGKADRDPDADGRDDPEDAGRGGDGS